MGWCFDRRGLAPLFTDAPLRSSVQEKSQVCYCERGEQGATAHSSKVPSGAIQRRFSEGRVRSQVTDYMEHNTPAVSCVVDGQLIQQTIYHKP